MLCRICSTHGEDPMITVVVDHHTPYSTHLLHLTNLSHTKMNTDCYICQSSHVDADRSKLDPLCQRDSQRTTAMQEHPEPPIAGQRW